MITAFEIRKKLLSLSDVSFCDFQSLLCPGTTNIIGIRVPVLRKYAKEISSQIDYKYIDLPARYYEENMLKGMLIGLVKDDIKKVFKMLETFIPAIDNWAVCDITCCDLKITNKHREEMWTFISKYFKSKNEFEIRFAVVMLLTYFINKEYITDILKILNNIKHDGYYVKMAVAWAVSVAFIKEQKTTINFLKNCNLDTWTYNKSLQKITESYRVSADTKKFIKSLKKS